MMVSLSISINGTNIVSGAPVPLPWILVTGFWNDSGVWDDSATWID